jgi:hypothetical protein
MSALTDNEVLDRLDDADISKNDTNKLVGRMGNHRRRPTSGYNEYRI